MGSLKPDYLIYSPFMITPEMFLKQNIFALIVDVDNTVIPWFEKQVSQNVKEWFEQLHQHHIDVILLSNNTTKRIAPIAAQLNVPFVANAKKPSAYGVQKALSLLTVKSEQVILIGDQLLTDISAAKKCQLKTILVKPLARDMIPTKMTRLIEFVALKKYKKRYQLDWRETIE
ncbi:YqeG family HAD IIIA-type phosphatase [Carnobacteriaceae bacterium zg-ZUI240]|nr:YqeG family HAD IIIA-type phosphatase [Carnobacteriaceae bacterium zg-ZUI240]